MPAGGTGYGITSPAAKPVGRVPLTRAIRRLVWHTTSSESWTVHTGNSIRSTNCKGAVRQADAVAEQTGDAFLASQPCSAIPGPQFPTSPFFRSKSSLNGGKSGSGQLSRCESSERVSPVAPPAFYERR